jgi:hypothetical protein
MFVCNHTGVCRPLPRVQASRNKDLDTLSAASTGQQDSRDILAALHAIHAQRQSLAQVLLKACSQASCPGSTPKGSINVDPLSSSMPASSSSALAAVSSDDGSGGRSEQTCSVCHALDLLHANVLRERSLLLQVLDMLLAQVRCCCLAHQSGNNVTDMSFVKLTHAYQHALKCNTILSQEYSDMLSVQRNTPSPMQVSPAVSRLVNATCAPPPGAQSTAQAAQAYNLRDSCRFRSMQFRISVGSLPGDNL